MYEQLRREVLKANLDLVKHGLVVLCWGNASQIDREHGVIAIKPSGVEYDTLTEEDISIVSLSDGSLLCGKKPSSDTPTHLELYRAFGNIGGVVHTHSDSATAFAQAGRELPCLGTTHADSFYGAVPITREMISEEVFGEYEKNTASVIVERFEGLDYAKIPAVLVRSHGPFCWGRNAASAVENAVILEQTAKIALATLALNPSAECPDTLLQKHFLRKHGENAYYGQ